MTLSRISRALFVQMNGWREMHVEAKHERVYFVCKLKACPPCSFNEHTPAAAIPPLLAPLKAGHDIGLQSEAGCPAVADPSAALVMAARRAGIAVVPLIGPSSILLALMASGLGGQRFAQGEFQRHECVECFAFFTPPISNECGELTVAFSVALQLDLREQCLGSPPVPMLRGTW